MTANRQIFIRILTLIMALVSASMAMAAGRSVTFTSAPANVLSPERGFYLWANDDFAKLTAGDVSGLRASGVTLVYALVRLDAFKAKPLTSAYLTQLDARFAHVRKAGVKVIFRTAYNYPANETDYLNAKDAPLAIVKQHIKQLAPVIAKNRDVIAVLQTGFIGAWGEGHTSSNKLDTPANKKAVIQALLAAWPKNLQIEWRYPPDLISWRAQKLPGIARVGLHNDCYLSSVTDVGTYSEVAATRAVERAKASAISASTFYAGETCAAEPANRRTGCANILKEGPLFHLSALNREYDLAFINAWKAGGCYATVEKSMGHRLRLLSATLDGNNKFALTMANSGWSKPFAARWIYVHWTGADGTTHKTKLGPTSIAAIGPGAQKTFSAQLAAGAKNICVSAPDIYTTTSSDPRYSIRFANTDDAAKNQNWNTKTGQFCFKL